MTEESDNNNKEKKAWIDIPPEEWLRGSTPANIESRCSTLCSEYLGGSWTTHVTDPIKDLEVRRIVGGLTNQLYYVALREHVPLVADEPREVTIKFYQKKHMPQEEPGNERLSDMVIVMLASHLGIGPRVYGLFDEGMIQSYYQHEQFQVKHQQNDRLLRTALHLLAKFNLLQVPLPKVAITLSEQGKQRIHTTFEEFKIPEKIREYGLETLAKYDLIQEYAWMMGVIEKAPNPKVFCHNDFRSSNILVNTGSGQPEVVLVDFEYGSYGLRGHDLACLLLEWGDGTWNSASFIKWKMPETEVLEKIARFYLEGCDLVCPGYSSQPGNSAVELINDIKLCCLEGLIMFTAWQACVRESLISSIEFDQRQNLQFAETIYALYHRVKQQLLDEGVITAN